MAETIRRVVDNRVFLLGLDAVYRKAMKRHEGDELLGCARVTAEALGVPPADGPVEGYYTETPQLTEYFRLRRALQGIKNSRAPTVDHLAQFRRLKQVCDSGLFGPPHDEGELLPTGDDPLAQAFEQFPVPDSWSIGSLLRQASAIAAQSADFSLVALGALASDAVVLTALRESVVLYARRFMSKCSKPEVEPEFVWAVDKRIEERASRFVSTFNELFGERLPAPASSTASIFWAAYVELEIDGRCVCIAVNQDISPPQHYHWAIDRDANDNLLVRDFWSPEVWTTERYWEQQSGSEASESKTMETVAKDGISMKMVDVTNWLRRRRR